MIREPAVAGQFYPASSAQIAAELDHYLHPVESKRHALAVIAPHAGWTYSGPTAGKVYESVEIPDRVLLIGPNHRNVGTDYAVFDCGKWQTPLGEVAICEPLAAELLDHCDLLAADCRAHTYEHSLEVQLPMLQRLNPQLQIVPLLIGGSWPWGGGRGNLRWIGAAIGEVVAGYSRNVLLIASTDLNHYEDQETARIKDKLVLDAVLDLDEEGLMQRVAEVDVSMCGVAATYITLVAAKHLGAKHAELIDHRTSGDVTGDFKSVVGYGGVAIW
jgi:AmmeMemoRadiSam system protein B